MSKELSKEPFNESSGRAASPPGGGGAPACPQLDDDTLASAFARVKATDRREAAFLDMVSLIPHDDGNVLCLHARSRTACDQVKLLAESLLAALAAEGRSYDRIEIVTGATTGLHVTKTVRS